MKLSPILLLSLLICVTLASTDDFQLPDLKVTTTDIDCFNYDALKTKANQDIERLQSFITNDVPKSSAFVQQALSLTQKACDLNQNLRTLKQASLMQIRNPLEDFSGIQVTLKELNDELGSANDDEDLFDLLIADKIKEASTMLANTDMTQEGDRAASICTDIILRLQDLIDFFKFLQDQIKSHYLDSFLPQRLKKIATLSSQCIRATTQAGTFSRVYYNTGHTMEQAQNVKRTDDLTVKFSQPFESTPKVGIALVGVDLNKDYPTINIDVVSAAVDSFVFRVTAEVNVQVYQIQISYIATLSDQTGIYLGRHSISNTEAEVAKTYIGTANSAPRVYKRSIAPPSNLKNPVALIFLRSFSFGAVYNPRLTVYALDPTAVNYKTYEDTIFISAATTILFYSSNDLTTTNKWLGITINGPLAADVIGPKQELAKLDISAYSGVPQIFFGIFHYDFFAKANHRLSQSLSEPSADSKVTLTVKNWYDTRTYGLRDMFVLTCPTKLNCLKK